VPVQKQQDAMTEAAPELPQRLKSSGPKPTNQNRRKKKERSTKLPFILFFRKK
jgi:hypothetical protein